MSATSDINDVGPKIVQELLSALAGGATVRELEAIVRGVTWPAVERWLRDGVELGYISEPDGADGRFQLAVVRQMKLKIVPTPTETNIAQRVNIVAERIVQVLADAGEPLTTNGIQRGFNRQRRPLVAFAVESLRQAGRVKPTGDGRWRLTG